VLVVRDDDARQFSRKYAEKKKRAACELEKGVFVLEKGVFTLDVLILPYS